MIQEILSSLSDPKNEGPIRIAIYFFGGVSGFLLSRFTLTASEKKTHNQVIYQNGIDHTREIEIKYIAFCDAIRDYSSKKKGFTLDDFHSVATTGDLYFGELKLVSDAILQGKINSGTRDRTFMPKIAEAWGKNVPLYYETLAVIAKKCGNSYSGKMERSNYLSIITVLEKYPLR